MKYDYTMRCSTDDRNGVICFANRYFTNIGQVQKNIVQMESPVLFYSNNPAGGEVSAERIGAFTFFNYNPDIRGVSSIGRFCSFAQNIIAGIGGHSTTALTHHQIFEVSQRWAEPFHHLSPEWLADNYRKNLEKEPNRLKKGAIGNDVWIGCNSIILRGVSIGDGAIVGAGSVVTKDVPPYAIVAGNPAKVIRMRFSQQVIDRLMEIKWWNYGPDVLNGLDISNPEKILDELEERIAGGFPEYRCDVFEFNPRLETITRISSDGTCREVIYDLKRKKE